MSNSSRKQVVIIGCGRMGAEMAMSISGHNYEVCVVDINPRSFERLGPPYRGRTVQGEGFDREVLRRAGIETASAFAAVTGQDSVNFVAARVARDIYHVPNVVVRVYNPRCTCLYEAFNLPMIDSATWGARRIEQLLLLPGLESVLACGSGDVKIYELAIPQAWDGRAIGELLPQEGAVAVSLTRGETGFLPDRGTVLKFRDLLDVGATAGAAAQLRRRLEGGQTSNGKKEAV
jgi:trk system potassium uptake protein TrkA